jgi:hypothetical protein
VRRLLEELIKALRELAGELARVEEAIRDTGLGAAADEVRRVER